MDSDADKTRMIRRTRPEPSQGAECSENTDVDPDATRIVHEGTKPHAAPPIPPAAEDDDVTRRLNTPPAESELISQSENVDSDKTQLMRRSSASQSAPAPVTAESVPGSSINDPVTAWLVVISGPGKGSQVALGEQDNRVGRGGGEETPRVSLNFGDAGISRTNAFVVRYDPKKRRFKLLPGEGTNIVYLNEEDLDSPTELNAGDVIELSETKLRFTPFCGEGFDWEDTE